MPMKPIALVRTPKILQGGCLNGPTLNARVFYVRSFEANNCRRNRSFKAAGGYKKPPVTAEATGSGSAAAVGRAVDGN